MSLAAAFIARLQSLPAGDRARLRQLAGQPLDEELEGFDLFTGLWWPLRQNSERAPERRSAWLVAKLYGAYPLPHVRDGPSLARRLGRIRLPAKEKERFRNRVDALLMAPLARLEPHLRWALGAISHSADQSAPPGLNWAELLDDLSRWERREKVRDRWAEEFLHPFTARGAKHEDDEID
jgi:CRISPR type I-E-associated protein CasB/Cse2